MGLIAILGGLFFLSWKDKINWQKRVSEMNTLEARLRRELFAVQMMAVSLINAAEDELKQRVSNCLLEAAEHRHKISSEQLFYGSAAHIRSNEKGMALVDEAKRAIEEFASSAGHNRMET